MKFVFFQAIILTGIALTLLLVLKIGNIALPSFVKNPQQTNTAVNILFGGDVMLGRSVTVQSLDSKESASYPFSHLVPLINQSDIFVVNLESPITSNCPRRTDGMIFCAPPEMLSGFPSEKTVVNLANNHTLNYGTDGLIQTKTFLSQKGIQYADSGNLAIKKISNITFGFLGLDKSQIANPTLSEKEQLFITESKAQVDILVVILHWGIEYQKHPTDGQRKLASDLVSLGANVIVGHHPHWVQDIEWIGDTPVYYSLGNLIFDQNWSEETRHGLLVKLTFQGKQITKEERFETYMKEIGQPIIMPSPKE